MAIGERIRFIRNLRGMTQKWLGVAVGFSEKTADIRMAQYEAGTRTPKADLTSKLASVLAVAPEALNVPDIEGYVGIMHTLFVLEDLYGFRVDRINGKTVIILDEKGENSELRMSFKCWLNRAIKMRTGKISREEYDNWRYSFSMNSLKNIFFNKKRKLITVTQDVSQTDDSSDQRR